MTALAMLRPRSSPWSRRLPKGGRPRPRAAPSREEEALMELGTTRLSSRRLEELQSEARYARDRYRLYRAKVHSPRPTSPGRLRGLERASNRADSMLRRAKSESEARR